MRLTGKHLVAGEWIASKGAPFRARDPRTGATLEPEYHDASPELIDRAVTAAREAFRRPEWRDTRRRSVFLRRLGETLLDLGDAWLERASAETGLPLNRLAGERARTVNQVNLFANLLDEGSYRDVRIDPADPERRPLPKPDLRRLLVPVGPVAVFGANNFPLAFSVAGGDTVSALAAGCPVVFKAHPGHPGTSEAAARAILQALEDCGLPPAVFSLVHGASNEVGHRLVTHPAVEAGAFTGSLTGGMALYAAAVNRPRPIPFFAEMGSVNPVVLSPLALERRAEQIAEGLFGSFTLGVGQFCTKPGLVFAVESAALQRFRARLIELVGAHPTETMLQEAIADRYAAGVEALRAAGAHLLAQGRPPAPEACTQASCFLFATSSEHFRSHPELQREVFGPCTLLVTCSSLEDLAETLSGLEGQLTGTVHAEPEERDLLAPIVSVLEEKVGRLIFNGYPTGVEVSPAMQHGGPFPATTDARFTSVGTAAILRFLRPLCYQNFPADWLPEVLRQAHTTRR
ncbi:MAG: aldehyde dehydrogenase (NADP(+)) [Acidobacteriota bacterium]